MYTHGSKYKSIPRILFISICTDFQNSKIPGQSQNMWIKSPNSLQFLQQHWDVLPNFGVMNGVLKNSCTQSQSFSTTFTALRYVRYLCRYVWMSECMTCVCKCLCQETYFIMRVRSHNNALPQEPEAERQSCAVHNHPRVLKTWGYTPRWRLTACPSRWRKEARLNSFSQRARAPTKWRTGQPTPPARQAKPTLLIKRFKTTSAHQSD